MCRICLKLIFFSCFTLFSWSQSSQALYFLEENWSVLSSPFRTIQPQCSYSYNPSLTHGSTLSLFCAIMCQGHCSVPISIKCISVKVNFVFLLSFLSVKNIWGQVNTWSGLDRQWKLELIILIFVIFRFFCFTEFLMKKSVSLSLASKNAFVYTYFFYNFLWTLS